MQRLPKIVRVLAVISFTLVVVLFAALIVNSFQNAGKPLTSLTPQGPSSESIQKLLVPVTSIAAIVFVLVIGAIVFITWKFRERNDGDPDEFPEQVHGKTTLEIGWTILPALILAGIAVGTVMTLINLNREEPNSINVQVAGQQWWWQYKYDVNNDGNFDGPEDITS